MRYGICLKPIGISPKGSLIRIYEIDDWHLNIGKDTWVVDGQDVHRLPEEEVFNILKSASI